MQLKAVIKNIAVQKKISPQGAQRRLFRFFISLKSPLSFRAKRGNSYINSSIFSGVTTIKLLL